MAQQLNPESNVLSKGMSLEQLSEAVSTSGYPLQGVVAEQLRRDFGVQEEWSYIDRDSSALRALDMIAQKWLYDDESLHELRVRPSIALLTECKQSQLPYVFFTTTSPSWVPDFPLIAGLRQDKVVLTTNNDPSTLTVSVQSCIGLEGHAFVSSQPVFCTTLSRAVRKGKGLELSGAEAYNGIVLPLVKALEYFSRSARPATTAIYYDIFMALGICVLEAPMVAVDAGGTTPKLTMAPWVRVQRQEATPGPSFPWDYGRRYFIDFVHKDFLSNYLSDWVLPFAQVFSTQVVKHQTILATGRGFVPRLFTGGRSDLEPRLRPVAAAERLARIRIIGVTMAKAPALVIKALSRKARY